MRDGSGREGSPEAPGREAIARRVAITRNPLPNWTAGPGKSERKEIVKFRARVRQKAGRAAPLRPVRAGTGRPGPARAGLGGRRRPAQRGPRRIGELVPTQTGRI